MKHAAMCLKAQGHESMVRLAESDLHCNAALQHATASYLLLLRPADLANLVAGTQVL